MDNKYRSIKLFAVMVFAFFVSMTITSAKRYEDIDSLLEGIVEKYETESHPVDYVYIIGNHVFTGSYAYTLKELNTASRTIPEGTDTYMYYVERTLDENLQPTGWNVEGAKDAYGSELKLNGPFTITLVDGVADPDFASYKETAKTGITTAFAELDPEVQELVEELKDAALDSIDIALNEDEVDEIVSSYNEIVDGIVGLWNDAKTLEAQQTAKKAELDALYEADKANYSDADKVALDKAYEAATEAIEDADDETTMGDAIQAYKDTKALLMTDEDKAEAALETAKDNAKKAIDKYADVLKEHGTYETNAQELADAITNAKRAIDAADLDNLNTALEKAKETMDAVKTDEELAAEALAQAKTNAKAALQTKYETLAPEVTEKDAELKEAQSNGNKAIDEASSIDAVTKAQTAAENAMDDVLTDAEIEALTINTDELTQNSVDKINSRVNKNTLELVKEGNKITVKVKSPKTLLSSEVTDPQNGIGLVAGLRDLLKLVFNKDTRLIDEIVLTYSRAEFVLNDDGWVEGEETNGSVVAATLNEMLKVMGGKDKLTNLDGKDITLEYKLNEKTINEGNITKYTIHFENEIKPVNTDKNVENILAKMFASTTEEEFKATVNAETGKVTLFNNKTKLSEATDLADVVAATLVEGVNLTITYNEHDYVFTQETAAAECEKLIAAIKTDVAETEDTTNVKTLTFKYTVEDYIVNEVTRKDITVIVDFIKYVNSDDTMYSFYETNKKVIENDSLTNDYYYVEDYTKGTKNLTVVLLDRAKDVKDTNIVSSIMELLNGDFQKVTLTSGEITEEITNANEAQTKFNLFIAKLLGEAVYSNALDVSNLYGKTFTITVTHKETITNQSATSGEYEVLFKAYVDVDKYVNEGFENVNKDPETFGFTTSLKDNVVTLNVKNDKEISSFAKTGLIAKLWELAGNKKVKSVTINIGSSTPIVLDEGTMTYEMTDMSKLASAITKAMAIALGKEEITNEKLSSLRNVDFKVTVQLIDNENVSSEMDKVNHTETYTIKVDSFVDLDALFTDIATLTNGSFKSEFIDHSLLYTITLNDNKITGASIINNIGSKIYNFVHDDNRISKVSINGKDLDTSSDDNAQRGMRSAFYQASGAKDLQSNLVNAFANENAKLNIEFTMISDSHTSHNHEDNTKDTYTITFKIANFEADKLLSSLTDASNKFFTSTYNAEAKELDVKLKSLTTKLDSDSINGTSLITTIAPYAGLIKSIKLGETSIDLTDIKGSIITELVKLTKVETPTINDLVGQSTKVTIELKDNVNEAEIVEFTVNFKTDAIADFNSGSGESFQTAVNDHDIINLTGSVSAPSAGLTIGEGKLINGSKEAIIKGNVTIEGSNVTLNNVSITGKVTVKGSNVEINGNRGSENGEDTTLISGGIVTESSAEKVTIDSVVVEGTATGLSTKDGKNAVISATDTKEFTLSNSKVSYLAGGEDARIYSLLYINGLANIEKNEIDITNVKNPIEFKVEEKVQDGTTIKDNKFTGSNADTNNAEARNVISIYDAEEGATIEISGNEFAYADWAVRISNSSNLEVKYIISNNTVVANANSDEEQTALIGLQATNENYDFSNVIIIAEGNTIAGKPYTVHEKYYETSEAEEKEPATRLYYVAFTGTATFSEAKMPQVNPSGE